jgi:hypothetical protein
MYDSCVKRQVSLSSHSAKEG